MKQFKTILTQLLLATTLMLPWATTEALETFQQAGAITEIGYEKFTVAGKEFRIAPGATLKSTDASRKKFADFKVGDEIWCKGKILNGVRLVDIITYETPSPS